MLNRTYDFVIRCLIEPFLTASGGIAIVAVALFQGVGTYFLLKMFCNLVISTINRNYSLDDIVLLHVLIIMISGGSGITTFFLSVNAVYAV
jgi:hypothetical protein